MFATKERAQLILAYSLEKSTKNFELSSIFCALMKWKYKWNLPIFAFPW